tara:strand:+ start:9989 stop:12667 length:2679 start_codon:yes stop_codon:yes gene_type:complete
MSKLILNKEQLTNLIETVVKDVLKKGPVYKKWTSISPEKREKIVNTSKILLEQEQEDDRDPVVRSYSTDDPTLQSKANSYYSIPQGGSWTIGRGGQPRGNDIVTVDQLTGNYKVWFPAENISYICNNATNYSNPETKNFWENVFGKPSTYKTGAAAPIHLNLEQQKYAEAFIRKSEEKMYNTVVEVLKDLDPSDLYNLFPRGVVWKEGAPPKGKIKHNDGKYYHFYTLKNPDNPKQHAAVKLGTSAIAKKKAGTGVVQPDKKIFLKGDNLSLGLPEANKGWWNALRMGVPRDAALKLIDAEEQVIASSIINSMVKGQYVAAHGETTNHFGCKPGFVMEMGWVFDDIKEFLSDLDHHTVFMVISIILAVIGSILTATGVGSPVGGVLLGASFIVDIIDAAFYFAEGDPYMGGLMLAIVIIPGGQLMKPLMKRLARFIANAVKGTKLSFPAWKTLARELNNKIGLKKMMNLLDSALETVSKFYKSIKSSGSRVLDSIESALKSKGINMSMNTIRGLLSKIETSIGYVIKFIKKLGGLLGGMLLGLGIYDLDAVKMAYNWVMPGDYWDLEVEWKYNRIGLWKWVKSSSRWFYENVDTDNICGIINTTPNFPDNADDMEPHKMLGTPYAGYYYCNLVYTSYVQQLLECGTRNYPGLSEDDCDSVQTYIKKAEDNILENGPTSQKKAWRKNKTIWFPEIDANMKKDKNDWRDHEMDITTELSDRGYSNPMACWVNNFEKPDKFLPDMKRAALICADQNEKGEVLYGPQKGKTRKPFLGGFASAWLDDKWRPDLATEKQQEQQGWVTFVTLLLEMDTVYEYEWIDENGNEQKQSLTPRQRVGIDLNMKPSEATTQKVIQALSEYYENNPNVELLEQINNITNPESKPDYQNIQKYFEN